MKLRLGIQNRIRRLRIREDLQATGVTVVAANDEESILQFTAM